MGYFQNCLRGGIASVLLAATAICGAQSPALGQQTVGSIKIGDLRCEYLREPLSIDDASPRLSWIVESARRGTKQAAYRILVASSPANLARGVGDLWDSGKVSSDATSQVAYQGNALVSREECYWSVQVWDEKGQAVTSAPAHWEMGILNSAAWKGEWIGRKHDPAAVPQEVREELNALVPVQTQSEPAPYLRKQITISSPVRRARIYYAAPGWAELHVNGKKVGGDNERETGFTSFNKRVQYVAHDVTTLLTPGDNVIGAILGTGWYDVHDVGDWSFEQAPWRDRPKLRLMLVIDYVDGRSETVASDGTWKTAAGPILYDGIYTGEVYDARREMPGWDTTKFDDKAWVAASIAKAPEGQLVALRCEPTAIWKTYVPKEVRDAGNGVYIVDMGQNMSGHAQITVNAPAGTTITIRYAEWVGANGQIDRRNIESKMHPVVDGVRLNPRQPFQTDVYICRGGGLETWEQRFSYSGYQYVEVTGFPGKPTADNFRGRFACTNFEKAGEFSCSNETLNNIQRMCEMSYLGNMQNYPTDCPQREKNGWTGDAQLLGDMGLLNYRSTTQYSKWVDDIADTQTPDGSVTHIVPSGGWGRPRSPDTEWDGALHICTWNLYQYSGDKRVLERLYEPMRLYVDACATVAADNGGLLAGSSYGDWSPFNVTTPKDVTANAYYFLETTIVANSAKIIGKDQDAAKYLKLAEDIKTRFNLRYHNAADQTYASNSQCAMSTALLLGLVPQENHAKVLARLTEDVEKLGHIDAGIIGTKNLLPVLTAGGRADLAFRMVTYPEAPGWVFWLNRGANTLWGGWKVTGGGSLNHGMWGTVSAWFYNGLAGINADAPGFTRIRIQPNPVGDLTWVNAWHDTPQGRVVSNWKRDGKTFTLNVTIPVNTTATVFMPAASADAVMESGKAAAQADGVRFLRQENGAAVYEVQSGNYVFSTAVAVAK